MSSSNGYDVSMGDQHRVIEVRSVSPTTFILTLERNRLAFTAGQCVNIGLPQTGINREYSTYSGEDDPHLEFLIKEVEGGQLSTKFRQLKPNDYVEIDGAYGQFTISRHMREQNPAFIFVGTGTGIAPFRSFVRTHDLIDYQVIHGVRENSEAYGWDGIPLEKYKPCVSQEQGDFYSGRVTDFLCRYPQSDQAIYFLCGNRNMINDVYDLLREQKVSGSSIITETFF